MRIAPVVGVLCVSLPIVGDADAAREPDAPSTTRSLRCVRLLTRAMWYHDSG